MSYFQLSRVKQPQQQNQRRDAPPPPQQPAQRQLSAEDFKKKRDYVLSFGHIAELLSSEIDFSDAAKVKELSFTVAADSAVYCYLFGDYAPYLALQIAKLVDGSRNPAVDAVAGSALNLTAGNYVVTFRAPGKLADLKTTVRVVIGALDKAKTAAARETYQKQCEQSRQAFLAAHAEQNKVFVDRGLDLLLDLDLPGLKSLLSCAEIADHLSDLHNTEWRREAYRDRVIATINEFIPVLPVARIVCSYARPLGAPPELRELMKSGSGDSVKNEEAVMFRSRGGAQLILRTDGSARLVEPTSGQQPQPRYFEGSFSAEMFEKPRDQSQSYPNLYGSVRSKVYGSLRLNLLFLDFDSGKRRETQLQPLHARGDQKEQKQPEKLSARWRTEVRMCSSRPCSHVPSRRHLKSWRTGSLCAGCRSRRLYIRGVTGELIVLITCRC